MAATPTIVGFVVLISRDVAQRRKAVLSLADAKSKLDDGDIDGGKAAALAAQQLAPGLIPAAVLAAEFLNLEGKTRQATTALKKAWSQNPHPDLAQAFAELKPEETPEERRKRFSALTRINTDNIETKLLKAELALADEDFPAARRAISGINDEDPTVRSLTVMAAIERGEGAPDETVRGWLTKALDAAKGNEWVCENCGTIHGDWGVICTNCEGFDTIEWKRPQRVERDASSTPLLGFTAGMLAGAAPVSNGTDQDETLVDVTPSASEATDKS